MAGDRFATYPMRTKVDDLPLPHNLEAERATLGAIFVDPQLWTAAAPVVAEADFYREFHRRIWRAMARCIERGVAIDPIVVGQEIGADLSERGDLIQMIDGVPRSMNVAHYAGIVREHAQRRAVIAVGRKITDQGLVGEDEARAVIDGGLQALADLVQRQGRGLIDAGVAVEQYVERLISGTAPPPVMTGFLDLDALTGGPRRGDLVIVAARPSVGKSSFGFQIAKHVASQGEDMAGFFSLEMSDDQLSARLLGWESGVPASRLERGTATDADYRAVADAAERLKALRLVIETSAITVSEIGAWCRAMAGQGLTCAVVDYLQLLRPDRRRESDEAEVAGISRSLKRLAKDLNIVVIALSQLNRAPEGRKDKRPATADLRGSGALEQDCDMAILLFREEMYTPTDANHGIAEAIVAKHRNGPTGVVRLQFLGELAQFNNLLTQTSVR